MTERRQVPQVGAPDPELKTSPIAWDADEDMDALREDVEGPVCYFNGETFGHDTHVQAGNARLRCDNGIWVPAGTPSD
jgi:hypothetical protein